MVEMNEAADILNNISNRVWYFSMNWDEGQVPMTEYRSQGNRRAYSRTSEELMQKHSLQLTTMSLTTWKRPTKRIANYNVSVKEIDNKVIFLRKLVKGGSEHSFGIHVAKMAGMPQSIVKRAGDILKQLESNNRQGTVSKKTPEITPAAAGGHATQFFPARRSRSESDKRRNHKYRHQQSDTDGGLEQTQRYPENYHRKINTSLNEHNRF